MATKIPKIEFTESQLSESNSNGNISSMLGDNSKFAESIEKGFVGAKQLLSSGISLPKLAARVTDNVIHPPVVGKLTPAGAGAGIGSLKGKLKKILRKPETQAALSEIGSSLEASRGGDSSSSGSQSDSPSEEDIFESFSTSSLDSIKGGFEGLLSAGGGSPDVIIQGLPAWRALIDIHLCPWHGPGIVIKGSTSVFINGFPATRILDEVVEIVPNVIIKGSPTVLIGD